MAEKQKELAADAGESGFEMEMDEGEDASEGVRVGGVVDVDESRMAVSGGIKSGSWRRRRSVCSLYVRSGGRFPK